MYVCVYMRYSHFVYVFCALYMFMFVHAWYYLDSVEENICAINYLRLSATALSATGEEAFVEHKYTCLCLRVEWWKLLNFSLD